MRQRRWFALFIASLALAWAGMSAVNPVSTPIGWADAGNRLAVQVAEGGMLGARVAGAAESSQDQSWSPYRQHPSDTQPTIVHVTCPESEATESRHRIMPGQRFRLRPSSCQAYKGYRVAEVEVPIDGGSEFFHGYAVWVDSFEPLDEETTPTGDERQRRRAEANAPLSASPGTPLPIMIDYRNYQQDLAPALVYAWYTDAFVQRQGAGGLQALQQQLAEIAAINDPDVDKMLMVSSYQTLEGVLAELDDELRRSGITTIGYNTERSVGTPAAELQAVHSADANSVARLARLAEEHGYGVVWGPIRRTVDEVPDAAIEAMVAAGLDGVALQEQKFIEREPVDRRVPAVEGTAARYRRIGGQAFHVSVQIMPSRCPGTGANRWAVCAEFIDRLSGTIDSVAIWASGQSDRAALPALVEAIR